jgi:hypothetical protein
MASVFKKGGKKVRGGVNQIDYVDEHGRTKRVSSKTTDKDAAEQIADQIEAEVALRRR